MFHFFCILISWFYPLIKLCIVHLKGQWWIVSLLPSLLLKFETLTFLWFLLLSLYFAISTLKVIVLFYVFFSNSFSSLDLFSTIGKCFFHQKYWLQKNQLWHLASWLVNHTRQVYLNMSKLITNHSNNLFLFMIFFTNGFL